MYEHIALAALGGCQTLSGTPSSYGIQQRRIAFAAGAGIAFALSGPECRRRAYVFHFGIRT